MRDLNSVLLEGTVQAVKPKRDRSGIWIDVKSRREREPNDEVGSHRFRVEVKEGMRGCPPNAFVIGQRIRVVGALRRAGRLGPFVQAEFVEFKAATEVLT